MKAEDLTQAPLSIDKLNLGHLSPWVFWNISTKPSRTGARTRQKRKSLLEQEARSRWDDGDDKLRRVRR